MQVQAGLLFFLDIDGVLHHRDGGEVLWPACIARVKRIASECDAQLVISSSWREHHDWRDFNAWFDGRVVGATPVLRERVPYLRYREVLEFLRQSGRTGDPWLAIDDHAAMYPPGAPVHEVDGEEAITDADVDAIIERVGAGDLIDRSRAEDLRAGRPAPFRLPRWLRRR